MARYIVRRILLIIPTMLVVSFLVYFIMDFMPGDPATIILGDAATPESVAEINEEFGFDQPFLVRYADYMLDVFHGDFGTSWKTGKPVMDEIATRFPVTVEIAVLGVVFASLIGVPIGILSAVKQYSVIDSISVVLALLFAAIPGFWLALMAMLIFSLKLGWFPTSGLDSLKSYVLPMMTIVLPQAASIMRFSRSTMLETIRQDYIRTARAKGASEKRVIFGHALKNALLPIITVMGVTFGHLLAGVVIVETVFSISGMGTFALNAIKMKDVPQIMAAVILLSVVFCLIMVVVDILYALVDPRVKASIVKSSKKSKALKTA